MANMSSNFIDREITDFAFSEEWLQDTMLIKRKSTYFDPERKTDYGS